MVETRNHSIVEEAEARITRPRLMNGYGLLPYDPTVGIPDNMIEVDINHMMGESPERKRAVMYLQLLRIVSGSTLGQNNMSMYKSYYKKNKGDGNISSQYYRLYLFRDVTSRDGELVYIVEGKM